MNSTIRQTILFSMLGGLAWTATAWAQGAMPPGEMKQAMFQRMDTNHDGRISAQEHAAGAQAMFARMDANRDGVLDSAELKAGHEWKGAGMRGGRMERLDVNHDGALTEAELLAPMHDKFARMDANHDGKVTADEMKVAHDTMHEDGDGETADMPRDGGMHAHEGMRGVMDPNHDGRITAAEHAAAAQVMFSRADSNHDGFLSQQELEAVHRHPQAK